MPPRKLKMNNQPSSSHSQLPMSPTQNFYPQFAPTPGATTAGRNPTAEEMLALWNLHHQAHQDPIQNQPLSPTYYPNTGFSQTHPHSQTHSHSQAQAHPHYQSQPSPQNYENVTSPTSFNIPSGQTQSLRPVKEEFKSTIFENDEDLTLCNIASNVSERPQQSRKAAFWQTITDEYNEEMGDRPRDTRSLQNRLTLLKKVGKWWKAATLKVEREEASGSNQLDVYNRKKELYEEISKTPFKFDYLCDHLMLLSSYSWKTTEGAFKKYNDISDDDTPKRSSGGSTKRSSDHLGVDEPESDFAEVSSPRGKDGRPSGVKKQKQMASSGKQPARKLFSSEVGAIRQGEMEANTKKLELLSMQIQMKKHEKEYKESFEWLKWLKGEATNEEGQKNYAEYLAYHRNKFHPTN